MRVVTLMVLYLIVVNIAGFAAMGIDKTRQEEGVQDTRGEPVHACDNRRQSGLDPGDAPVPS